jgi:hypothetical protein
LSPSMLRRMLSRLGRVVELGGIAARYCHGTVCETGVGCGCKGGRWTRRAQARTTGRKEQEHALFFCGPSPPPPNCANVAVALASGYHHSYHHSHGNIFIDHTTVTPTSTAQHQLGFMICICTLSKHTRNTRLPMIKRELFTNEPRNKARAPSTRTIAARDFGRLQLELCTRVFSKSIGAASMTAVTAVAAPIAALSSPIGCSWISYAFESSCLP